MGRNKFSAQEIKEIKGLLRRKNSTKRFGQKMIRHVLRTDYEFSISDFNEPGKAFGEAELDAALERGAILVLDDATIAARRSVRATVHVTRRRAWRLILRRRARTGRRPWRSGSSGRTHKPTRRRKHDEMQIYPGNVLGSIIAADRR